MGVFVAGTQEVMNAISEPGVDVFFLSRNISGLRAIKEIRIKEMFRVCLGGVDFLLKSRNNRSVNRPEFFAQDAFSCDDGVFYLGLESGIWIGFFYEMRSCSVVFWELNKRPKLRKYPVDVKYPAYSEEEVSCQDTKYSSRAFANFIGTKIESVYLIERASYANPEDRMTRSMFQCGIAIVNDRKESLVVAVKVKTKIYPSFFGACNISDIASDDIEHLVCCEVGQPSVVFPFSHLLQCL